MSQFSPDVSPALNLRNHISSAIGKVIYLLENLISSGCDENQLDYSLYKLEQVIYLCVCSPKRPDFVSEEVIQLLLTAHNSLSQENTENNSHLTSSCQTIYTGSTGRPALSIPRETLRLYLSYGFSLQKIADMFKYDNISNESLDSVVSAVLHNFPNCGTRRMKGFLLGGGIRVQWSRVRSSLWRTDPSGILLRTSQLNIVNRRHYSVPGPRSLWHLDDNHKLIRWGFIIHGCVDGFSRRLCFWNAVPITRQLQYYSCFKLQSRILDFPLGSEVTKALRTLK